MDTSGLDAKIARRLRGALECTGRPIGQGKGATCVYHLIRGQEKASEYA